MTGALLTLLQLRDSALPIGRYAHSHGLESWLGSHPTARGEAVVAAVWAGVGSVATLDAVFLRCALTADDLAEVLALDAGLHASKPARAARDSSSACGRQLAALARDLGPHSEVTGGLLGAVAAGRTPGGLAVVEGRLLGDAGVGAGDAVAAALQSAAAGLLAAAVRLGRIGPREAQVVLWRGRPRLAELTGRSLLLSPDGAYAGTPELELHLMRQEDTSGRLFRS